MIIISERIANFVMILISMREGSVSDRATRKWQTDEKEIKLIWAKRADGTILPRRLHPFARMILMIEIKDDDVTMIVEIVMVIEETTEVVEIVEVADKSTSLETGTPFLTSSITHLTCNCGGADINSTYR